MGLVDLHAKIKFQVETYYDTDGKRLPQPEMRLVDTTVGRVIFNNILPPEMRFKNVILDKGAIKDLISEVYQVCDQEVTTEVADSIKDIGFEFSMRSGATIAVSDITIPETKNTMLADADNEVDQINRQWRRGLLTEQERNDRTIDVWQDTTAKIAKEVRNNMDPQGNMAVMANSGATKGGFGPIAQLAGMRGLMGRPIWPYYPAAD